MKSIRKVVSMLGLVAMTITGCKTNTPASSVKGDSSVAATSTPTSTGVDKSTYKYNFLIGSPNDQLAWVRLKVLGWLNENGYTNCTVSTFALEENDAGGNEKVTDWSKGPDIYAFAGDQLLGLRAKGALAKVPTKLVNTMKTEMGDVVGGAGQLGDDYYGYPFTSNTFFLYYDTDFVSADQAKTMDGLIAANKTAGLKMNYKFSDGWYGIPSLMSYGASWDITLNETGDAISSVKTDFNGAKGLKAAKEIVKCVRNADFISNDGTQTGPSEDNGYGAIASGVWNYANFEKTAGTGKLKATVLPKFGTGTDAVAMKNFLGYKMYGVNPKGYGTDTVKAGIEYNIAAYLASDEMQEERYAVANYLPLSIKASSSETVKNDQAAQAITAMASYSVPQTVVPSGVWTAWEAFYSTISATSFDPTDANIQTALDAFDTAAEKIGD
ncbi:MAG: hypothetical protein WCS80_02885 [Bacilli bacterium]